MLPFELWLLLWSYAPDPIFSYVRDSDGRLTYAGVANRGSLLADASWKVVKVYNDSNGLPQHFRSSAVNQIFNNYATLDYKATDL